MDKALPATQRCLGCGLEKQLDAFHRAPKGKYGRRSKCIECWKPYYQEYFKKPDRIEKTLASSRAFYARREDKAELMASIRLRREVDPSYALGKSLRRGLERHPTENPTTLNELLEMLRKQGGRCAISGLEMTWAKRMHLPTSISIDRIDSSRGYSTDNIRLVCYQVNLFRGMWTDVEMMTMAKAIVAHMEHAAASDAVAGYLSLAA